MPNRRNTEVALFVHAGDRLPNFQDKSPVWYRFTHDALFGCYLCARTRDHYQFATTGDVSITPHQIRPPQATKLIPYFLFFPVRASPHFWPGRFDFHWNVGHYGPRWHWVSQCNTFHVPSISHRRIRRVPGCETSPVPVLLAQRVGGSNQPDVGPKRKGVANTAFGIKRSVTV